ncbi:MAG: hypothetical protein MZW92_22035 [Comamonadaceae bacterium]|nr:hypothetical protein [Comamonadaceae bacterium]
MMLLLSCVMPAALALPRQESVPGGVALLRLADARRRTAARLVSGQSRCWCGSGATAGTPWSGCR